MAALMVDIPPALVEVLVTTPASCLVCYAIAPGLGPSTGTSGDSALSERLVLQEPLSLAAMFQNSR